MKLWDTFGAKLYGVNMLKNKNYNGAPIMDRWIFESGHKYERMKGFKKLTWQLYISDWQSIKKTVGMNKYDFYDVVLSGNVKSLAKIVADPEKKAAFFEALEVDYDGASWAKDWPDVKEVATRSGASTRNYQAMADAVACIITALKDGCAVVHDNFMKDDYETINSRRRNNEINKNDL